MQGSIFPFACTTKRMGKDHCNVTETMKNKPRRKREKNEKKKEKKKRFKKVMRKNMEDRCVEIGVKVIANY